MSGDQPSAPGSMPLKLIDRVDQARDRYESRWRTGQRPQIEEFIDDAPDIERTAILRELLSLDIDLRRSKGERPLPQDYRPRFPDHSWLIEVIFNGDSAEIGKPDLPSTLPLGLLVEEPAPGEASTYRSVSQDGSGEVAETQAAAQTTLFEPTDGDSPPATLPSAGGGLASPPIVLPQSLERYEMDRLIGEGQFGKVYLARDTKLDRPVAVKVPKAESFASEREVDKFFSEAKLAAGLNHPGIVTVHDVGRRADGTVFVVMEYVEGETLRDLLKRSQLNIERAVELMIQVAEAAHHAHKRKMVHRDLKPANILIDVDGNPHVADFGLAVHEETVATRHGEIAGTPAYMAPEQVRGEAHRLDCRTDLWSLGVILYQLLTGRKPFPGDQQATFDGILHRQPKLPRLHDERIPLELQRICLKTLSKRMSDRYDNAAGMADDLRYWLAHQSEESADGSISKILSAKAAHTTGSHSSRDEVVAVVPKGLRSFDSEDADFFLRLLPGPRDREGLPETLRFWRTRIEETDPDKTFNVGLIYGPSGSGKSSLVKAGLLPRLAEHVLPVYMEAISEGTEEKLLASVRRRCPNLPAGLSLAEALAALRDGGLANGQKLLIVLDQFEQWLHARPDDLDTELTRALRQCDGQHVQCIVMVRDDFWMAMTRFVRELEIQLSEGVNSEAIDLFEPSHARHVLAEFGRAFGALPQHEEEQTVEQTRFLDQSIAGLKRPDETIIPVRLSLFSEMVRHKPWTPATLREVGGPEGIGAAFLEETFSASGAPPEHRLHQKAARWVLKALLPEQGVDIKGNMRSQSALLEASGYARRPADFDELMRILDNELRLVTPTDPSAQADEADTPGGPARSEERCYQLTHDDLVPSLRQWLSRKQRETMRGRAQLRLEDHTQLWAIRPQRRHLPSFWEWPDILLLTNHREWTPPQRKMMAAATRHHLSQLAVAVLVLVLLVGVGLELRRQSRNRQDEIHAAGLVQQLRVADIGQVPDIVESMGGFRRWTDPLIRRVANAPKASEKERLRASLALLPVEPGQAGYLRDRMLTSTPDDLVVIRGALLPYRAALLEPLWNLAEDEQAESDNRFRAACALASFDPASKSWERVAEPVANQLVKLVSENPLLLNRWLELLHPARQRLLEPLAMISRDTERPGESRFMAASILADYATDDVVFFVDLVVRSNPRQFSKLYPKLLAFDRTRVLELLRAVLEQKLDAQPTEDAKDELASRQANAATALVRLGVDAPAWPLLVHKPDPRVRSALLNAFQPLGVDPQTLVKRLRQERDLSARRALLLALADYKPEDFEPRERKELVGQLVDSFCDDPDPGIHSAAELVLKSWGRAAELLSVKSKLSGRPPAPGNGWYLNQDGDTMVIIDPRAASVPLFSPRRPRSVYSISTHEVTVEQYLRFDSGHHVPPSSGPELDCPVSVVKWYEAAKYCNWRSAQEGIPKSEWCYPDEVEPGFTLSSDSLTRTGYRLPTDAEWEYAARAGAVTVRYYGRSVELLPKYAWFLDNSHMHTWPVGRLKPNDYGLFDILGNIQEWCQDSHEHLSDKKDGLDVVDPNPVTETRLRAIRSGSYSKEAAATVLDARDTGVPVTEFNSVGFRIMRTLPKPAS